MSDVKVGDHVAATKDIEHWHTVTGIVIAIKGEEVEVRIDDDAKYADGTQCSYRGRNLSATHIWEKVTPATDDGDYVRVKRMTEAEANAFADDLSCAVMHPFRMEMVKDARHAGIYRALKTLGLIALTPTTAERIAANTGISASDVEQVLAALKEYGE